MKTSTNTLENLFAVFVSTSGLVLFALLIGNVQVQTLFWHCWYFLVMYFIRLSGNQLVLIRPTYRKESFDVHLQI
jgi:hypothetical protein